MRKILFRGKSVSSDDWVYGLYVEATRRLAEGRTHKSWIVGDFVAKSGWAVPTRHTAVADDTVSQYTGIKDKYGHKIFEGDILKVVKERREGITHVAYVGESFYAPEFDVEIIGNIYDNPDLI